MVALYTKKYGLAHAPLGVLLGALCLAAVGGKTFFITQARDDRDSGCDGDCGIVVGFKIDQQAWPKTAFNRSEQCTSGITTSAAAAAAAATILSARANIRTHAARLNPG